MERKRVGLRALKSNLSGIVARARDGQEIVVTDRGAPVARLLPLSSDDPLERLIAEGLVEPAPTRRRITPRPSIRLRGRGPSLSGYVVAQRR
jgi:prevent-host-death family protein